MKDQYLISIRLIERLHRRFLDVIKAELDRLGIEDVNNVQTLILFNINEDQLTVGELTVRGYYLGSNVSYNVKKLVDLGFINHQRSRIDRRSVRISLTEEGQEIAETVATRWPLAGWTIIHRFGKILPGEEIVFVACASQHRQAAFEAASCIMDFMKTEAPFWKREHLVDGSIGAWVEARDTDAAATDRWHRL